MAWDWRGEYEKQFGVKPAEPVLPPHVDVPEWVPADLHMIYRDLARKKDEFYAARVVRKLKAGREDRP